LRRTAIPADAWKQWIAAALWLGLIAIESTDLLSSEHTGRFLYHWAVRLFGPVNPIRFEFWHHYLRKAGHFVGYAVLSSLLFRAWRATFPAGERPGWTFRWSWTFRWMSGAFITTVLVAGLDEWHQSMIPSRTGTLRDLALDSTAAAVALLLIWLFSKNLRSQAISRARVTSSG
jgi:VanZ family protein